MSGDRPPASNSRLPSAYARVWDAFTASATTADGRHDTSQWRARNGPYALCVIRVAADVLQPALDRFRHGLAGLAGVRLHPDHFLHVTIQELGFVVDAPNRSDEISPARLEEFALAAVDPISTIRSFPFLLGGGNSFQDAAFLEIRRASPLTWLHERLFEIAAVAQPPAYAYLPHCTVAHYDGTTSPPAATAVIQPWRDTIFGECMAAEVEVVTIDPTRPYPELESYAAIPLAS